MILPSGISPSSETGARMHNNNRVFFLPSHTLQQINYPSDTEISLGLDEQRLTPEGDIKYNFLEVWKAAKQFRKNPNLQCKPIHVIPTCDGTHWFVMVVDFSTSRIYSIDSYGKYEKDKEEGKLRAILHLLLCPKEINTRSSKTKRRETVHRTAFAFIDKWRYESLVLPTSCRQPASNSTDCGVFACMIGRAIMINPEVLTDTSLFNPSEINVQLCDRWRSRILSSILSQNRITID